MNSPYNCGCDSDDEVEYPKLRAGDTVGIISPSFSPRNTYENPEELAEKIKKDFGLFGLKVKFAKHWLSTANFPYSGTVQERANDIMEMFKDKEVKLIMPSYGGQGVISVLPRLNYREIEKHPKIFMGSGDANFLNSAFQKKADLRSVYGPIGTSLWTDDMRRWFCCTLMKAKEMKFTSPDAKVIVPGRARGKLVGGNLDVLLMAPLTDYFYNLDMPYVFFLYATIGTTFEFEQILHAMDQAGIFKNAKALVFGQCMTCFPNPGEIDEMVRKVWCKYPNIPSFTNANITSSDGSFILPINTSVQINADKKEIKMIEPIVE